MNGFLIVASMIAIATYFPLCKQIKSGSVKQNLLTWILWGCIDWLIGIEIFFEGGNFLLAITYAFGSFSTTVFIFKAKHENIWTKFESIVVFLVFISMVMWYLSGGKWAIVASTTAMVISGIPQLVDAYKKPHDMPLLAYLAYLAANCFSVVGAKEWSVEERLYPVCAGILCLSAVVFMARRFWIKKQ